LEGFGVLSSVIEDRELTGFIAKLIVTWTIPVEDLSPNTFDGILAG
jgi:hypothetical protein